MLRHAAVSTKTYGSRTAFSVASAFDRIKGIHHVRESSHIKNVKQSQRIFTPDLTAVTLESDERFGMSNRDSTGRDGPGMSDSLYVSASDAHASKDHVHSITVNFNR